MGNVGYECKYSKVVSGQRVGGSRDHRASPAPEERWRYDRWWNGRGRVAAAECAIITVWPPTMSFEYAVGYRDARLSILVLHLGFVCTYIFIFLSIHTTEFPWGLNVVSHVC